jgi:uncharacterized protein (TIGR03000 family)
MTRCMRSTALAVIMAAVGLMLLPQTAEAQRYRGWGGGRGSSFGIYYSSPGYGWGTPYYRDYGYSYYPRSGYYWSPSYSYWSPNYSTAQAYYPESSYQSNYPQQTTSQQGHLIVQVPNANAEIWVNGNAMPQRGTTRHFYSPALEPGYTYSYEVRARWTQDGQQMNETRTVRFQPGQQVTVDFRSAGQNLPAPREKTPID